MNKQFRVMMVALLCAAVLAAGVVSAFGATRSDSGSASTSVGLEAAKTLSTITGVAISPLLGVGAIGAYQWWKAPSERRGRLSWFAQPWFWIPALLLAALVGVKDVVGTATPTALKKPFDVAETVENKVSGLIAAGAFVPLIISVFPSGGGSSLGLSDYGFAAISAGSIGNLLLVPFAIIAFAIVWLLSHAINILILISPFTTLDTGLKAFRLFILGSVTLTSFTNPYVGAFLCVLIILLGWFMAGWTLRLTVLGTVYSWDFFTLRRHRFVPQPNGNWMFLAREMEKVPVRTYGRLFAEEGKLRFEYRPLLVLPKKVFELPAGEYAVGRGFFYPEIGMIEGEGLRTAFILPPRYRGHEAETAKAAGITKVCDVGLRKGLKAAWNWMKSLFMGRSEPDEPQLTLAG
jgi:hypothetical protein